ncbi:hypothetical protein ACWNX2_00595 [Candidatus Vidania fulgoroideorum]
MVFKFTKLLGKQLLRFATCFRNYKQRVIYIRFLPTYIVFAYSDLYISIIYYNIWSTSLNCCIALDYRFIVKVLADSYDFDIYFDFFKTQLVFTAAAVSFTTYKVLHSDYSYSITLLTKGDATYIEAVLLLYPVFLKITDLNFGKCMYYLLNDNSVSYLSFDDFRVLLVRKSSTLISLNYCFTFSFDVVTILRRAMVYFMLSDSCHLQFNNNMVQINGINLFIATYITTNLDFNYTAVLAITSDYHYISINTNELLRALSFIRSLHGDINCDFYITIVGDVLTVGYFSSFIGKLVSSIAICATSLDLKLCLNLGFCIEFLLLYPYEVFVLAVLDAYSKVFMLSCDLYSYVYCIMPILT